MFGIKCQYAEYQEHDFYNTVPLFRYALQSVSEQNYILKNQNISGYNFRVGFYVLQIIALCITVIFLLKIIIMMINVCVSSGFRRQVDKNCGLLP